MTNQKPTDPDVLVNKLFAKLQEKKKLLESLEKPQFKTNLSFGFDKTNSSRINLHTVTDTDILVDIAAFLMERAKMHKEAAELLQVESDFKWLGFSLQEWLHDLKTRANKINIDTRRKEFKQLEDKLNSLVSPEQRRLMELEAISKILE